MVNLSPQDWSRVTLLVGPGRKSPSCHTQLPICLPSLLTPERPLCLKPGPDLGWGAVGGAHEGLVRLTRVLGPQERLGAASGRSTPSWLGEAELGTVCVLPLGPTASPLSTRPCPTLHDFSDIVRLRRRQVWRTAAGLAGFP